MFKIGISSIQKVVEMELNAMTLHELMPDLNGELLEKHPRWLIPGTSDSQGHALLSLHTWLVRHEGKVLLVDTCAGNDKSRPQQRGLDHLSNPFLDRLALAGIAPEDVDVILHTHIHSDHVGWNTKLVDGRWVPTFPNAEVIVSDLEWRYGAALTDGDDVGIARARSEAGLGEPVRTPVSGTFGDSMRPLEGRSTVRRIRIDESEALPGIRFVPTPGHSIDHAAIELTSEGEVALFGGDVFHHPLEIFQPDLVSSFCEFPDAARKSRRSFMERAARDAAVVFTAHFARSSAGRIIRSGDDYEWQFS